MLIDVFIVVVLPITSPVANKTRYDLTMPFRIEGGSQLMVIDVEFKVLAVTFSGALGAMYAGRNFVLLKLSLQFNVDQLHCDILPSNYRCWPCFGTMQQLKTAF